MSSGEPKAPPGWYPFGTGERYWDGEAWTDQIRESPSVDVRPVRSEDVDVRVVDVVENAEYESPLSGIRFEVVLDDDHPESARVLTTHGWQAITLFKPRIVTRLPEGWFAKESVTVLAPDEQANLIASSEPLDPDVDVNRYAHVQGDPLHTEFPGYRELAFEPASAFGHENGYFRHFTWNPPDSDPVTQLQIYYVENERGYTATASVPSVQFARFEVRLRELLRDLRLSSRGPTR